MSFSSVVICDEMRGAWVTAWEKGFLTPDECDSTIADAKAANLNTLFIQVRKNSDAYYNSNIEPRGSNLRFGFDPLAYIIEKAHSQGLQVHAWINVFRVWTTSAPPSDPNHLVNAHKDWLNRNFKGNMQASEGIYLDPGVPEAREYLASVVRDIAQHYQVDGIHLDYIRYPGRDWGYSDIALANYYAEAGNVNRPKPDNDQWTQWRRDQVTATVESIRKAVHEIKPNLMISAATIPWGKCTGNFCDASPYTDVCQDWKQWLADGLIDANIPMNYKEEKSSRTAMQFRGWLAGFKRWSGGKPVYVGVDAGHNNRFEVLRQIQAVRNAGLNGFVLYAFNQTPARDLLVSSLKSSNTTVCEAVLLKNDTSSPSKDAFDRGIRFAVANQLGLAEVNLKRALELDPCNAEAGYRLGRVYLKEHNLTKANEYFKIALDIDPSHAGAKAELAAIQK